MRFYSFVAGLYLSELQKGLQSGHAVSNLSVEYNITDQRHWKYLEWARKHKTMIILNAHNHAGVTGVYEKLKDWAEVLGLPITIFMEDEQSMNSMATAVGIVVPEHLYEAQREYIQNVAVPFGQKQPFRWVYFKPTDDGNYKHETYEDGSPEYEFLNIIKSYNLT